MDEQQNIRPIILLFDEYGRPLLIKDPFQKRAIGFKANDIKKEILNE